MKARSSPAVPIPAQRLRDALAMLGALEYLGGIATRRELVEMIPWLTPHEFRRALADLELAERVVLVHGSRPRTYVARGPRQEEAP